MRKRQNGLESFYNDLEDVYSKHKENLNEQDRQAFDDVFIYVEKEYIKADQLAEDE